MKKKISIIGNRYGRLTVLDEEYINGRNYCHCICDCGNKKTVRRDHLLSGRVLSCKCIATERLINRSTTHDLSRTRIYRVWKGMRNRCKLETVHNYKNYGGRGIKVCDEWQEFLPFYEWAIANGYQEGLSIDRINNDGDYEPSNCRWATNKEQSLNRRTNVFLTLNGVTKPISEWDKDIGATKSGRVRARLNAGWSIESALTVPIQRGANQYDSQSRNISYEKNNGCPL